MPRPVRELLCAAHDRARVVRPAGDAHGANRGQRLSSVLPQIRLQRRLEGPRVRGKAAKRRFRRSRVHAIRVVKPPEVLRRFFDLEIASKDAAAAATAAAAAAAIHERRSGGSFGGGSGGSSGGGSNGGSCGGIDGSVDDRRHVRRSLCKLRRAEVDRSFGRRRRRRQFE